MQALFESMLADYESGKISRRNLVRNLAVLSGLAATGHTAAAADSPFQAVGTNHVALSVTDIERSSNFYSSLLGMPVVSRSSSSCFLELRTGFLALFKSSNAGLNHFCLAVDNYDVGRADELLKQQGLEPRRPSGTQRIYFDDPDGIEVQLSAEDHKA